LQWRRQFDQGSAIGVRVTSGRMVRKVEQNCAEADKG
jgi:hypothetical protein